MLGFLKSHWKVLAAAGGVVAGGAAGYALWRQSRGPRGTVTVGELVVLTENGPVREGDLLVPGDWS